MMLSVSSDMFASASTDTPKRCLLVMMNHADEYDTTTLLDAYIQGFLAATKYKSWTSGPYNLNLQYMR